MKFGWINIFGAAIVVLMLIPNIIYAIKNKDEKNLCKNRAMNILEQIGRYGCIILMWLPLFVWEFGFAGVAQMIIYAAGNSALLLAYFIVYALYFKEKNARRALALAIIPACMFMLSGILLRHPLLIVFAILFAIGHIFVTAKNIKET